MIHKAINGKHETSFQEVDRIRPKKINVPTLILKEFFLILPKEKGNEERVFLMVTCKVLLLYLEYSEAKT